MLDKKCILSGEFCAFRHIKTRKAFVIEIEFAEEMGQEVLRVLGMPIGGESKPVAVALLGSGTLPKLMPEPKTEGEKLRIKAVILCNERAFEDYCYEKYAVTSEAIKFQMNSHNCSVVVARCINVIYQECNIKSRSELATNLEAQTKFRELLAKFDAWKLENQYSDNLSRI